MFMGKWVGLACLAAAVAAASGCRRGGNDLDGAYRITGMELSGDKIPTAMLDLLTETERTVVIRDGKLKVYFFGTVESDAISFDPTKVPAEFDLTSEKSSKAHHGIYKLEGDTLTLCFDPGSPPARLWQNLGDRSKGKRIEPRKDGPPPPKRPTEFKSSPESGSILLVLELMREKK